MGEMSDEVIQKFMKKLDLHIGKFALKQLKSFGDGINQIELSTDRKETHSSVWLRSVRVAQELKKRGIGLNDKLVICAHTHNDVSIPILAGLYIGCATFPLSMTMTKTEVKNMLSIGKPSIVFSDPEIAQTFSEVLAELKYEAEVVVFGDKPLGGPYVPFADFLQPTGTEDAFEVTELDPSETFAFISCSSGTTGMPKGVCHTHKTFGLGFFLMYLTPRVDPKIKSNIRTPSDQKPIYLSFSTVYWVSGLYNMMISAFSGVTRVNCAVPYSVDLLEKGLNKYKPQMIMISPVGMCQLVKHPKFLNLDWSSIKKFYVAASPVSPEIVTQIQKQIPNGIMIHAYGMTELRSVSANMEGIPKSVGKLYPWIHWRVVDPETELALGPNQVGELRLKSACLFHSYLENPVATAEAYDEDGWYKTGDLLYFNEDKNIFIVDRLKEVMKFRNFQITPAELEFEIMKVADVIQVAVVGRRHPEDGEHPMAFVQRVEGSKVTAQQIKDTVKNTLSDTKQLRGGVVFLESLPATPSGKVDRKNLKKLALEVTGE